MKPKSSGCRQSWTKEVIGKTPQTGRIAERVPLIQAMSVALQGRVDVRDHAVDNVVAGEGNVGDHSGGTNASFFILCTW